MVGLSYIPEYENMEQEKYDYLFGEIARQIEKHDYYSFKNRMLLVKCMQELNLDKLTTAHRLILEIGVGRKERLVNTSTFTLLGYKAVTTKYYGIDKSDRIFWKQNFKNIEILQAKSEDVFPTWDWDIDLLHIDGSHSVNGVLTDWQFTLFVKPYGIIVLHDIKAHPGPNLLVDAIDRDIYTVHKLFLNDPKDFGMAVVYKKENDYGRIFNRIT
jgi:hypothetical protein